MKKYKTKYEIGLVSTEIPCGGFTLRNMTQRCKIKREKILQMRSSGVVSVLCGTKSYKSKSSWLLLVLVREVGEGQGIEFEGETLQTWAIMRSRATLYEAQ